MTPDLEDRVLQELLTLRQQILATQGEALPSTTTPLIQEVATALGPLREIAAVRRLRQGREISLEEGVLRASPVTPSSSDLSVIVVQFTDGQIIAYNAETELGVQAMDREDAFEVSKRLEGRFPTSLVVVIPIQEAFALQCCRRLEELALERDGLNDSLRVLLLAKIREAAEIHLPDFLARPRQTGITGILWLKRD